MARAKDQVICAVILWDSDRKSDAQRLQLLDGQKGGCQRRGTALDVTSLALAEE